MQGKVISWPSTTSSSCGFVTHSGGTLGKSFYSYAKVEHQRDFNERYVGGFGESREEVKWKGNIKGNIDDEDGFPTKCGFQVSY